MKSEYNCTCSFPKDDASNRVIRERVRKHFEHCERKRFRHRGLDFVYAIDHGAHAMANTEDPAGYYEEMLFVTAVVPEPLREIVAYHEYIETRYGSKVVGHEVACLLERGFARELGKEEMLLDWVRSYPIEREPEYFLD
ncbi:hypothetical protein ACFL0V_01875 [Nanoarchaeota archaeon]